MHAQIKLNRRKAFDRQNGRCFYCGIAMWLQHPGELAVSTPSAKAAQHLRCTAEHLIPRSEGGKNCPDNIAAACARCNHTRHKRKRTPLPLVYKQQVTRQVAKGKWHHRWVFEAGLLSFAAPRER